MQPDLNLLGHSDAFIIPGNIAKVAGYRPVILKYDPETNNLLTHV